MGKLARIKTTETDSSVNAFIDSVESYQKRKDALILLKLMEKTMKVKPRMWGSSIIGFGNLLYKSPTSGREVEWFKIGFSPRKAALTIYLMDIKLHTDGLKKLGKHKLGGGCLYINKLDDVDMKVLEGMIIAAIKRKVV